MWSFEYMMLSGYVIKNSFAIYNILLYCFKEKNV